MRLPNSAVTNYSLASLFHSVPHSQYDPPIEQQPGRYSLLGKQRRACVWSKETCLRFRPDWESNPGPLAREARALTTTLRDSDYYYDRTRTRT
uniref:Uncharacterized protein n=1 Tax=Callorhinchus milii TaxID=7868 RepID=A0A4W3KF37_CALMI